MSICFWHIKMSESLWVIGKVGVQDMRASGTQILESRFAFSDCVTLNKSFNLARILHCSSSNKIYYQNANYYYIILQKIKTMQIESFKLIILSTSLPNHEGSLWYSLVRFVQYRLKWPHQSDFYHLFWEVVSLIFYATPSFLGSLQLNRQGEENVEQHYKNVNS